MIMISSKTTLPAGRIKRIHVNQNLLRRAMKGEDVLPYIVRYGGSSWSCRDFEIDGPAKGVNSIHKPLSCGARLWIKTTSYMTLNS